MKKQILEFDREYRFLSNFWPATINIDGAEYPTVEHYYQAMKSDNPSIQDTIRNLSGPGKAKRYGKQVTLRGDWEKIKMGIMEKGIKAKFEQHPELMRKLIELKDYELIEGNNWGDDFWGVTLDNMIGDNFLGKLLMKIRDENLPKETETKDPNREISWLPIHQHGVLK